MIKPDTVSACLALALSGLYYYKITGLEKRGFKSGELGPEVFPTLVVIIFAGLATILLVKGLVSKPEKREKLTRNWRRMAISMLSCVGYVALLSQAGFLIATAVFLVFFVWLYGARKIWVIAAASVVPTAVIYLVFWKFFHILLP
jgi:hypothetical protein